jgi:putative thioredoxin
MELKQSFETEVLDASKKKPVLVDFWAPWCGPCQILGPVLEEIAKERNDELTLVKVNIDEHQNLATQFGVRGIPHVILFHKGESIHSFSGALSKTQVNNWLDENLPSAEKEEWKALENQWNEVPNEKAIPPLKKFAEKHSEIEEARVLLARHLAFFNPEEASQFVEDIKMESDHYDTAEYVRKVESRKDSQQYRSFIEDLIENELLIAFQHLNQRILKADKEEKEMLEKLGVALYSLVNSREKEILKARKVFDMYTS